MHKTIKGKKLFPYLRKTDLNKKAAEAYMTYSTTVLKGQAPGNTHPVWEDLFPNQREAWRKVVMQLLNLGK